MSHTEDPRLDRLPEWDDRNLDYPIRTAIPSTFPTVGRGWSVRTWLDQGREGACVGFAWAHELAALPNRVPSNDAAARFIYHEAQKIDQWAGEDHVGTSVLAGAKVVKNLGHMREYRWARSVREIVMAVCYEGPVIMGTPWYDGMYRPDDQGFLHPEGDVVGGHAYLLSSVSVAKRYFGIWNSWGEDWGDRGRAKITWDDMETLFDGDACVPMSRT